MTYKKEELLLMAQKNEGNLDLAYSDVTNLPNNLVINGSINLNESKIRKLPKGLKCKGLSIMKTEISELPSDIEIDGDCDLRLTKIKNLPENFSVSGKLKLYGTLVSTLPKSISIHSLELYKNKIVFPEEMVITGDLSIIDSTIIGLSRSLIVKRNLIIMESKFTFPKKLRVNRNVDLIECKISAFPDDMSIGGMFNIIRTDVSLNLLDIHVGDGIYVDGNPEDLSKDNSGIINVYQETEKLLIVETVGRKLLFDIHKVEELEDKTVYHATGEVVVKKNGFMGVGTTIEEAEFLCLYEKMVANKKFYLNVSDTDVFTAEELVIIFALIDDDELEFDIIEDDLKLWFKDMKSKGETFTVAEFKKING